jgi:hypothetical protein
VNVVKVCLGVGMLARDRQTKVNENRFSRMAAGALRMFEEDIESIVEGLYMGS